MNPKRFLSLALVASLLLTIGCETLKQINWAAVAQTAVQIGAAFLVRGNPEIAPQINLASSLLDSFVAAKPADVAKLQAALGTSIDPQLASVLAAGIDQLAPQLAAAPEAERDAIWSQGLRALQAGLAAGLTKAPAAAPPEIRSRAVAALRQRGITL